VREPCSCGGRRATAYDSECDFDYDCLYRVLVRAMHEWEGAMQLLAGGKRLGVSVTVAVVVAVAAPGNNVCANQGSTFHFPTFGGLLVQAL
jgi:hypothetical protein